MSERRTSKAALRIGILGGTFDPIHNGHLALARRARRELKLNEVYFVPCGRPPHKDRPGLSPYLHRYAMVALACAGERRFVPSLLEAGSKLDGATRTYSVDTVTRLRRRVGARARLFFLLGADAFLYLPTWKNWRRLLGLCEFVVAPRPGIGPARTRQVWLRLSGAKARVHFLSGVRSSVSATRIRRRARSGRSLKGLVPRSVADYVEATSLYRSGQ